MIVQHRIALDTAGIFAGPALAYPLYAWLLSNVPSEYGDALPVHDAAGSVTVAVFIAGAAPTSAAASETLPEASGSFSLIVETEPEPLRPLYTLNVVYCPLSKVILYTSVVPAA